MEWFGTIIDWASDSGNSNLVRTIVALLAIPGALWGCYLLYLKLSSAGIDDRLAAHERKLNKLLQTRQEKDLVERTRSLADKTRDEVIDRRNRANKWRADAEALRVQFASDRNHAAAARKDAAGLKVRGKIDAAKDIELIASRFDQHAADCEDMAKQCERLATDLENFSSESLDKVEKLEKEVAKLIPPTE